MGLADISRKAKYRKHNYKQRRQKPYIPLMEPNYDICCRLMFVGDNFDVDSFGTDKTYIDDVVRVTTITSLILRAFGSETRELTSIYNHS